MNNPSEIVFLCLFEHVLCGILLRVTFSSHLAVCRRCTLDFASRESPHNSKIPLSLSLSLSLKYRTIISLTLWISNNHFVYSMNTEQSFRWLYEYRTIISSTLSLEGPEIRVYKVPLRSHCLPIRREGEGIFVEKIIHCRSDCVLEMSSSSPIFETPHRVLGGPDLPVRISSVAVHYNLVFVATHRGSIRIYVHHYHTGTSRP